MLRLGLLATETDLSDPRRPRVGGNPLDAALWAAAGDAAAALAGYKRLGLLPFDHDRRMTSAVVAGAATATGCSW